MRRKKYVSIPMIPLAFPFRIPQNRRRPSNAVLPLTSQQTALEQIIKNLQRENAMITTAWYDLTSRLQSNHVVLQRRHDAPRSWLNKQRQMVNGESLLDPATMPLNTTVPY